MKFDKQFSLDSFCGGIPEYSKVAAKSLGEYIDCPISILEELAYVKNFIDLKKYVLLMNIIEIHHNTINKHYAYMTLSLEKKDVDKLSQIILQGIESKMQTPELKTSAIKESMNRIGAKLLGFISCEGNTYDIGTPIVYAMPNKSMVQGEDSQIHVWPTLFQCMKLKVGTIEMEFGCTVLEAPARRFDLHLTMLTNYLLGGSKSKYKTTIEKEIAASELPTLFNLHLLIRLVSCEQVILSLPSKYITQLAPVFDISVVNADKLPVRIAEILHECPHIMSVDTDFKMIPAEHSKRITKIFQIQTDKPISRFCLTWMPPTIEG